MTPIPVPVRRRILQLYERGKSTREIASGSVFAWRRCAACGSSFTSAVRWSHGLIAAGAAR
jgi:hypothetical protein